ncbi:tetratricopeptide repeat protein [Photobacterium sp. ZSDE20]|uniref:Tetratricopeptide repeat protein n=2 Tax=Vibrionaceae TaxID=641 RepID=A0ABT1N4E8_9GAMM|nr:multiheme c-type cytochrome [Photobacterium sp. ZSDE20]MCQ1058992.1 tetratricopeptide repeat protein [Photobacterium sp. ZSDE20]MDD1823993.1 tetratricopeptide repeat protein [Photobacterium sp. ZSDE20]
MARLNWYSGCIIVLLGLLVVLLIRQPVLGQTSTYVGSEACMDCHDEQVKAWRGSHHEMAMKHAAADSVLGNFSDETLKHNGKTNRFFKKEGEYWVHIAGADQQFADFKISYTFGVYPLQQYMVEFPDGRVQLIPFAWDSRPPEQGGQRWFHLYPETTPVDEFYWTNAGQNWNFMCADCHSTNLKKNYDEKSDSYDTTWSEINVGCEACHGPASAHIEYIAKSSDKLTTSDSNELIHANTLMGFDRDLSEAVKEWVFLDGHKTLQPKSIHPTDQLQTCAQCHSRRTQLNESASHVKGSFLDKYRLSLITPELYYPDGQIYDEDYVYGSFLQSRMAEKGVTCTNCHDPHTAQLKIPEEAVCSQCHVSPKYVSSKHTLHDAGTEAAKCTTCHMPETTYMQVDPRRDHSWHVPRPDLSKHINTPNVCTGCHEDKTNQWADEVLVKHFPDSDYRQQHFGVAFYADSIGHNAAPDALSYTAQDASLSDIIRASALSRIAGNTGQNTLVAIARAVKNDSEFIRLGAIEGSSGYGWPERWQILSPLLNDPVLSVRTETAGALVGYWSQMNIQQRSSLNKPLQEYIEIQKFNADRGFGRTNLGNVYRALGEMDEAIEWYQGAIEIEPYFANSYVNLADLYRNQKQEGLALEVLQQGIKAQPNDSVLPYSAGLAYLRVGKTKQANGYLKQAAEMAADNPHYWYVYGLALEKTDVLASSKALSAAFRISGNPQHLYAQCEVLARNYQQGEVASDFERCTQQLGKIVPPEVVSQLKLQVRN